MSVKLIVCLSFLVFVVGDDIPINDEHHKTMVRCMKENNVSDEEVHEFSKEPKEPTLEIKNFFLCFTQGLGVFNGINWNLEEVRKLVKEDVKMKAVEECLAQDDKTLEARERNIALVMCTLQKEAFL